MDMGNSVIIAIWGGGQGGQVKERIGGINGDGQTLDLEW